MLKLSLPKIGFGTWENTEPDICSKSVQTAVDIGYRLIDTAQIYKNEEAVGKGISHTNIPRDELILCSKVWIENLSHEKVLSSTNESLK
jgi:2,5-diketo-D-gluconate reductase B